MAQSNQFQPVITTNLTATIADGQTESGSVDLSGTTLVGLQIPAEFEGAAIGFKAAISAQGSFLPVYDASGTAIAASAAADQLVLLQAAQFAGLRHIKLVADTAQTGACTLTLLTRPV